ncbi:hypothetical protein ACS0TY_024256 [Phlomoides rotata]
MSLWQLRQLVMEALSKNKSYHGNLYPKSLGFGYDSDSDDYKVVVVIDEVEIEFRTFICSLKSKSWKRVEDSPCNRL